jgi:hypothetical protein
LHALILAKKGNHEHQTGNQKEDTSEHRPKTTYTGDDKSYSRDDKQDPARKIDMMIAHYGL